MSTWKIAAGVCLGLMAFTAVNRYIEQRQAKAGVEQFVQDMQKMEAESNRQFAEANWRREEKRREDRARANWQAQQHAEAMRVKEDERCISHQRFKRVENGWVQTGSC